MPVVSAGRFRTLDTPTLGQRYEESFHSLPTVKENRYTAHIDLGTLSTERGH